MPCCDGVSLLHYCAVEVRLIKSQRLHISALNAGNLRSRFEYFLGIAALGEVLVILISKLRKILPLFNDFVINCLYALANKTIRVGPRRLSGEALRPEGANELVI